MPVAFKWKGKVETKSGLAIFTIENATYELRLPNFEKALQLDQFLRDVHAQGRRKGHAEMMRATSDAMNETARRLRLRRQATLKSAISTE